METNVKYAVGLDLGGTSVKYSVIDSEGAILFHGKIPSRAQESAEAITGQLIAAVEFCRQEAVRREIILEGVGIGTPGIVDAGQRNIVGGAENLAGWNHIPLADRIEQATGLRTAVDNDANLMALGETRFGAAKGYTDVVFLTVGTGIGGGVLIGGKLYGGYANRGTELGHVPLIADGEPCPCGAIGCLERYASTAALVRRFLHRCEVADVKHESEVDGELIVKLFHADDPIAVESLEEHCHFLGQGVAGIINTFSPQRVIIGGGISEAGDFYIEKINRHAMRYAVEACAANTKIVAASLGNRAGSYGGVALILD